ncbi:MAG: ABC transporter permease [Dehalococcoidia bacterium]|nr:ABC transporter permease [Dehalococcoidia bacterium]
MRAFGAVFVSYYRQFVRDRGALFFTFIFPIMFILLFGWAFRSEGARRFDIALVDQGSPQSAAIITFALDNVTLDSGDRLFRLESGPFDDMMRLLEDGKLDGIMVIPAAMDASLALGQPTTIQIYYDPARISNQQILVPVLNQVVNGLNQYLQGTTPLITLDEETVQSRELRYIDYLVPGVLGMSLMFSGIYGGLPIIQQRQAHIIKRLGATPLRRSMLIFGDLAFRMILVLLTAALIILVGSLVFDVQMVGNWFSLCGVVVLGSLVFTSLGYLMAAFVKTEEAAIPIINVVAMPMMFLSGTFFEITSMPSFIEPLIKALPLTYLNDALRQIMVDGTPVHSMTTDIAVLAAWTAVCLGITIRFFKWD